MTSEIEVKMWMEALVRQNEKEPLGYPERLELEQKIMQAFHECKVQEQRADEALHNQIEHHKADWETAIASLRQAAEEKQQQEQQLAEARALLEALFDESAGIFYEIPEPLWHRWCLWMVANESPDDARRTQAQEWLQHYYPAEVQP